MKRMLCAMTVASLIITLNCGWTSTASTQWTALQGNQPMNRELLDRNQPVPEQSQPENQQESQTESRDAYYNDPYLSLQWGVTQTNADLAWAQVEQEASVVVAVVDTGVDYTHEDLENRVLVDLGYDFVNDDDDPMDDNGHGTHVSGIIAAEANNGVGIAGIAGDLDVSILPVKVLNADGEGTTATISAGILYAVEMGADIINLSVGADVISNDVRSAIETALAADIFVVVAAGNDGTQCAPLSLANLDGVFTVAAASDDSTVAYFSNYGDCIDAYAPGEDILSTYLDNQYAYQDGTSMAAPIVSGAAAVLLAQDADLTVAELTALLSNDETSTTTTTTPQTNTPQTSPVQTVPVLISPMMPMMPNVSVRSFVPIGGVNAMFYTSYSNTQSCTCIDIYQSLLQIL